MPRKQKKYHFIYKTINIITNKYYIGMHSTDNIDDGYLGSGKRLWYSINKYGKENHKIEILEYLSNRKELSDREKEIVNEQLLNDKMCMNLVIGGYSGIYKFTIEDQKKGRKIANEILRKKYGDRFISKMLNNYYKNEPEEHKNNRIENIKRTHKEIGFDYKKFLNKKHSDESKRKIGKANSIHQKGDKNSQYGTCWIYNIELKENKKIKKEYLNDWLNNGWVNGRKMKF